VEPLRSGHFLLGFQGLAILRAWGIDDDAVRARVHDMEAILAGLDEPQLSIPWDARETDTDEGYAVMASGYDEPGNVVIQAEEEPVRRLLSELPASRILGAACGTGRHAAFFAERGHEVIGVDQSEDMLEVARARSIPGTFTGSLEALPVETGSVDAAVCALALTHLPRLGPALGELSRVVRPGGRVVISDVHPFFTALGLHSFARLEEGRIGVIRNHFHPITAYLDAFQRSGLSVVSCLEPEWPALEQRNVQGPGSLLAIFPEATRQATEGLPLVLAWALVKAR
jgi:ubiquinone/menaquinone biosynthesis C-methylase UbiE